MTRYSKILAVFVAVSSLAFAGFAIATTFGGPDWQAILRTKEFQNYHISHFAGENPVWNATKGVEEERIASSVRLPEVISKVMDDIIQQQRKEIQALEEQEPRLQERVQILEASLKADLEALRQSEAFQRQRLAELRVRESQVAGQVISATAEAQKIENLTVERREDIIRLQQLVNELKADQFRLEQIQNQLVNEITQREGDLQRAEHRNRLLTQE